MSGLMKIWKSIERRKAPRFAFPDGIVTIDEHKYQLADISTTGLRIDPFEGNLSTGDDFSFSLALTDRGIPLTYDGTGTVVRIDERGLAATYTMAEGSPPLPFADFFHSLTVGL